MRNTRAGHWLAPLGLGALLFTSALGTGCISNRIPGPALSRSTVPADRGPGDYEWDYRGERKPGTAEEYCNDVERSTRTAAGEILVGAWVLGVTAVGAASIPAIITAANTDNTIGAPEKAANVVGPLLSALAVAGAIAAFTRADHDNQVAKVAGLAIADGVDSKSKAQVCTKAIADWNGARGDASEALRELLTKQKPKDGDPLADDKRKKGDAPPAGSTTPDAGAPPPTGTAPVTPPPTGTAPVTPPPG